MSIILISTLVPVALVLGAVTGSLAFWHKSRRKAARQGFAPQASNYGIDSMQSSKALNKHMGSKELSGLTSANSSTSFTAMSVDGSQNPLASTAPKPDGVAMPPAWITDIPFSDWEIDADDVAICLRPDGRKWELGAGAFSKVGLKPCNAIQGHGMVTASHGTFGRHECVFMACVVSLLHSAHKHSCLPTSCHCGHTCYAWKSSGSHAMVCQPKFLRTTHATRQPLERLQAAITQTIP